MSTLKPEMLNVSSTINGTVITNTTTMVPLTNLNMTSTTEVNPFLSQWNITDNGNNGGYWNYSTSWNNSGYGNGYWNDSTWIPYCPSCYPVVVDTPSYTYFSYAYIYYILLMMLFIGAIICIKLGMDKRRQVERQVAAQRRRAQQQAQDAYLTSNSTLNINADSSCHMGAKSADGPPAYDSVIQPHLNTREQNSTTNGVEGATSTTDNTNGISTITIESDVPSNAANNASNTQATGESANVAAPPTTTIIDIAANEKSKDSIV